MAYTAESGHWYDRDGTPRYTIVGKNGKERNTNVRDARKNGYVPSVTEICKLMAKPGLEHWKQEQIKLAALTLPKIENETLDQFSRRISYDANQQSNDARDIGTAIHAQIERYFLGKPVLKYKDTIQTLIKQMHLVFGDQAWEPEKSFAHHYGFGGKVDLYSPEWVIDFKTKDFGPDDMKKTFSYNEHLVQLNAYRLGLQRDTSTGIANIFISRTVPGLIKIEIHEEDPQIDFTLQFTSMLIIWQEQKKYRSGFKQIVA